VIRSVAPVLQNQHRTPDNVMLQTATFLRKFAPCSPNIFDGDVFCTASATRHTSLHNLFKHSMPAMVFETAAKLSRLVHFWQSAESALATKNDGSTSKGGLNVLCF
jgi:hypothetical protein